MGESDGILRDRPEHGWQTDLVEAVLRTHAFGDPHARALLAWLTDAELPDPLPPADSGDQGGAVLRCMQLVRHCDHVPGGLQALVTALRLLEPDEEAARRVADLVGEREIRRPPPTALPGPATDTPTASARHAGGHKDFFVSYTTPDQRWAVWIAWELEEAGFSVLVQEWDFVPGSNWQFGMERGTAECERILAVLSPAYLESVYGRLEWQAAQGADPTGFARRLIPIRIAPCRPRGLLATLVFIDLVGLTVGQARERLLGGMDGVRIGRSKPETPPGFPG